MATTKASLASATLGLANLRTLLKGVNDDKVDALVDQKEAERLDECIWRLLDYAQAQEKVEATRDALLAIGAKVQVKRRKLRHREKTYLHVVAEGGHYEWRTIVMPVIYRHFPHAYMTSGSFTSEMNLTIALEK